MQRLGPPHWPKYPPAAVYGRFTTAIGREGLAAARLGARLIAADLAAVGIDVDCMPLADVPVAGADAVIGDRAFGAEPDKVSALAGGVCRGFAGRRRLAGLKHMPGHGRATADSHQKLPVVTADKTDIGSHGFCRVSAACRAAACHDRPRGVHSHRRGRPGHHFGRYSA